MTADFTLSPPAFPKFFNFIVCPKMKFNLKPHYYYEDAVSHPLVLLHMGHMKRSVLGIMHFLS